MKDLADSRTTINYFLDNLKIKNSGGGVKERDNFRRKLITFWKKIIALELLQLNESMQKSNYTEFSDDHRLP